MLTYDIDALQADASQHTFSRHFRSGRLEQMYRAHAFQLGRRRIARLFLLFVVLEVYVIASTLYEDKGMRTSAMQLYVPVAILISALAFLLSKFNSPSRLPVMMWLVIVSYVSAILGPMLDKAINFSPPGNTTSHNITSQQESVILTGEREHDATWTAGCWYMAAFATAVWGDSSGMGPAGCVTLFWILAAMHAATMGMAYNKIDSDARGQFKAIIPQLLIAGVMNAYLAWIACEASRQMFLASALASMHRVDQLTAEKERLNYERQFAETKLRMAWSSGASSKPQEKGSGREGPGQEWSAREGSRSEERSASRAGSESTSSNSELGAIHTRGSSCGPRSSNSSNSELDAISQKAARAAMRPAKPARCRKVRVCSPSAQARVSPSMLSPTFEEDKEERQPTPAQPLAVTNLSTIPDEEAGEPSPSSPDRKRTREMADLPIGCCPSDSDAASSAAVESAKVPSDATSATADELRSAFTRPPAKSALAALPRSLVDYVFALRGQRPPGPMPGQMPAGMVADRADPAPCAAPSSSVPTAQDDL